MNTKEQQHLEDTWAILVDYDGARSVDSLKALIDEARQRIRTVLDGQTEEDHG